MMTVAQQSVLDFVTNNPGALTTDIVAALYATDPNGDLLVSVCLAALERRGLIDVQPEAGAVSVREAMGIMVQELVEERNG